MATTDSFRKAIRHCLFWGALFASHSAWACLDCRKIVEAQVYGADFASNLLALFLPLVILAAVGTAAYFTESLLDRLLNGHHEP
jgi:hypothetical protein